jgi:hypothetical protein
MKKRIVTAFALVLAGCVTIPNGGNIPMNETDNMIGASNRVAVCIGLTSVNPGAYQGWAGDCPGCDIDAKGLYRLFLNEGFSAHLILNSAATWEYVRNTILDSSKFLKAGDLLVVSISGHGGQIPDDDGDEPSGQDSTLCLRDGQVRDDDFLKMIQKLPNGIRLVLINDQCHSEGNFKALWRQVKRGVTLGSSGKKVAIPLIRGVGTNQVQLIQFAGCREANYSYGSSKGGTWTQNLLSAYKPELTWRQWFDNANKLMPRQQVPVWTLYPEGGVSEEFINGSVLR